jgi:hypothetical protein
MADQPTVTGEAEAKERLAQDQVLTDKSKKEYAERMKGKPTPTQEENDLAACGAQFLEHEPDGSDPDPYATKQMEPKKPSGSGNYQTRQSAPSRHTSHTAGSHPSSS